MSKSTIWNQLKALGYDSKQLKSDTGKTYQSANEQLLQSILNKLQPTVINEVTVTDDAVQDIATIDEQVISASEVNLDSSDTTDTATFEVINQPIVTIPVEVNTQSAVIDDPWLTTDKYLPTNYHGIPYRNLDEVVLVNGTKATVIENDTYFLFYTDKKPEDGIGANYSFLKSCNTRQQIQQTYGIKGADKFIKQYHKEDDPAYEQVLIHFLLNYTKTPVTASTAYKVEIPEASNNTSEVIVKASEPVVTYSIISTVPNRPIETLLTTTSLEVLVKKAKSLPGYYRIEKTINEETFTVNLSELTKTTVQSPVTANTTTEVNIPEQVKQVSETSTEATETISSANEVEMNTTINEPVNSYAFSFQEQKLPITVLEVASNDNKRIEVVNLQDAYFIELRDDKLYVSYGLHIKTFKASNYRIVKAFNSLLNGSNFIHLRDLRENNRDILVNLNRVKTIERKKNKIVFHWNGLLTYPGVHKLSDWQVID